MNASCGTGDAVMRLSSAGDRAILVDLPDLETVLRLQSALRARNLTGIVDIVAADVTVLVVADCPASARRIARTLPGLDLAAAPVAAGVTVLIETVYDGEDLDEVGVLTGLGRDGVITAHTRTAWRAAFGGFAPGFAYLSGGDPRLRVPRRTSPRTSVPAGSVAIAGDYSAVYPRASPGGWQLLGRTGMQLFDASHEPPARIQPGDRVEFRAVRDIVVVRQEARTPAPSTRAAALVVGDPGPLALLQDLGRQGFAHIGVTRSGALDRAAHRRANRLVGNQPNAVTIESLAGGLTLTAIRDQVCAITGGLSGARVLGGRLLPADAPFALLAGETLDMGTVGVGLRGYLAVRGGFTSAAVLGSAATDTLAALGPRALTAGDRLRVGEPVGVVGAPEPAPAHPTTLRYVPGPRADWFVAPSLMALDDREWTVSPRSNRIGLRLDGTALVRRRAGELPSEALALGSIQVPPDGQPVVFLADHPVTGGYPVIGVVIGDDLDAAAQLAPGTRLRFRAVPGLGSTAPSDPPPLPPEGTVE